jgi:hypothetical protein
LFVDKNILSSENITKVVYKYSKVYFCKNEAGYMQEFDLAIAYTWEYDKDFVNLTESILQNAGINTFIIGEQNIFEVTENILNRKLSFNYYLDRASDVNEDFEELAKILTRRKCRIFNPYKNIEHATDKASMHLEFITAGLNVPYSIIIPPHSQEEEIYISVDDLSLLGRPFIIKPCNTTGGGIGVVRGAESLKEVIEERITNSDDKYLIQEKVYPTMIVDKRAWFRCFWAFGKAIAVWWDDLTHFYTELRVDEMKSNITKKLLKQTKLIAEITGLDFFSTEIVINPDNQFIVIDYVNDQCDMRLKSKHADGVPDSVVLKIIKNMQQFILKEKQ